MTRRLTTRQRERLAQRDARLTDDQRAALDHARHLIECGVPVFAASPALKPKAGGGMEWDPTGGHEGMGYWLPKRWQTRKPDLAELDQWLPGDALCAVMGHVVDGVDVDPHKGGAESLASLNGTMPKVYGVASTPSGGQHHLIAALGVHSRDAVLPGLDIKAGVSDEERGGHGFIFIAPTAKLSKTTGEVGAYRWEVGPELTPLDLLGPGKDKTGADLAARVEAAHAAKGKAFRTYTGPAYAGPAYGALDPAQQAQAAGAQSERVESLRGRLAAALAWKEGYTDHKGRGWEQLALGAATELACMVACPWLPMTQDEAMAVWEDVLPPEMGGASSVPGKEDAPPLSQKLCDSRFAYAATLPVKPPPWEVAPELTAAEVFGVVEPDAADHGDPLRCRHVNEDGTMCRAFRMSHDGTPIRDYCRPHAFEHPKEDDAAEGKAATSWKRQDVRAGLAGIKSGKTKRPKPTVGQMADGGCLFYKGRISTLFGVSGAAKTWVAVETVKQEIEAGENVLFIDFEDDLTSALIRLMVIGTDEDAIAERFHYIAPEDVLDEKTRVKLAKTMKKLRPSLVVIDSTGESLALEALDPNSDPDVAQWVRRLPKLATKSGAAVVVVDHLPKSDPTALGPIGSQRKRAATWCAYRVEKVEEFSSGVAGSSRIVATKDKGGHHRMNEAIGILRAQPDDDRELRLPNEDGGEDVIRCMTLHLSAVDVPTPQERRNATLERCMVQVSAYVKKMRDQWAEHEENTDDSEHAGLSINAIVPEVTGNKQAVTDAVTALVRDGYLKPTTASRNQQHPKYTHVELYVGEENSAASVFDVVGDDSADAVGAGSD